MIAMAGTSFGFDFAPDSDWARVVSDAGDNLRIDPNTGNLAGFDAPLNLGATSADAVAFTNNSATATARTQYVLSGMTNSLYRSAAPNTGTLDLVMAVTLAGGGAPLDFTSVGGFDILPNVDAATSGAPVAAGSGIAALTVGGVARLYSIDLTTAIATPLGTIGDGAAPVQGMALHGERHPGGLPAIYARGTNLYRFDTAAPGTTVTVPVATELDSVAWRPQTGQLYGISLDPISKALTIYHVNPAAMPQVTSRSSSTVSSSAARRLREDGRCSSIRGSSRARGR